MAKYNAANHTIESDSGELLATLSNSIRADDGFEIADNWSGQITRELLDQIDDLGCEIQRAEDKNSDLREEIRGLETDKEKLTEEVEAADERIAELEAEIRRLEAEKGDAQ